MQRAEAGADGSDKGGILGAGSGASTGDPTRAAEAVERVLDRPDGAPMEGGEVGDGSARRSGSEEAVALSGGPGHRCARLT